MGKLIIKGVMAIQLVVTIAACGASDSGETPAPESSPQSDTVDWNYLQNEYAEFFEAKCPIDSKDPMVSFCLSDQHSKLLAFQSDAVELPRSSERAGLLQQIQELDEKYKEYEGENCQIRQSPSVICIMSPVNISHRVDRIARDVNKYSQS